MSVQSDDQSQASPATSTSPPASDAPPAADQDTVPAELAELEQKADEYKRLAQRTQADFINYRRRIEEERAQLAQNATIAYLLRLLPILDDFERALASADQAQLDSNWGKGILLVERNLRGLLAGDDVQRIEADGAEFDPREHEAVGRQPSADVPDGHVLHIVRQGYRRGERVIRPAQVIVASAPESSG